MENKSEESQFYIKQLTSKETPYNTELCGLMLRIDYGVYPAGEVGELFNKALSSLNWLDDKIQLVFDYGTGSGFLAIQAIKHGAHRVIASDISKHAIDCAGYNFTQHQVADLIELRHGNAFEVIKEDEKFDLILASLPWENSIPNEKVPLEQSFYDSDFKMRTDLFNNAKKHLSTNGHIFFSYSRKAQKRNPIEHHINGFTCTIVAEEEFEGDTHYIYDIKP